MTDREQSRGRELLAINDPARRGAEGKDDALEFRRLLETLLTKYGLRVVEGRHALQLRLSVGPIINILNTGTVQLRGRRPELAREFVEELRAGIAELRHHRDAP